MTEKRFIGSSGGVYDQYKSNRFVWSEWEEILQIMNNLNEKARERSKALSKLQKENKQLQHDATVLIQSNRDYRKENEELKEELNAFKPVMFQDRQKGTIILYRKGDVE